MSGLEILGAVAASVQLVRVAQSCLGLIHEISKGCKHKDETEFMHFLLLAEAVAFDRWCAANMISDMIDLKQISPNSWEQSSSFTEFRKKLEENLRFSNGNIADIVLRFVTFLEEKFQMAFKLVNGHQQSIASVDTDTSAVKNPPFKRRWFRSSRSSTKREGGDHDADNARSKKIQALKWIGIDKRTFEILLDEIQKTNKALLTFLPRYQQERIHRQTTMKMLSSISTSSGNHASSIEDCELAALVGIKVLNDQDQTGRSSWSDSIERPFHLHTLTTTDFQGSMVDVAEARSIGKLDDGIVVIEWKYYNKDRSVMGWTARLKSLVGLLNQQDLFEKFLAPKCRGLVEDPLRSRIGILFNVSTAAGSTAEAVSEYHDLQTFVRNPSVPIPSIGDRFHIANKLATAVHHLHSVNWLHKSLRSDNIIFFKQVANVNISSTKISEPPIASDPSAPQVEHVKNVLDGLECLDEGPAPLPRICVLGWDLSRPNDSSEFSESQSMPPAKFQSKRDNIRLYSHPDTHSGITSTSKSSSKLRNHFRAEFDIYSLGLVLLEIGLWRTLDSLRRKCESEDEFYQKLRGEFCHKLRAKMGTIYWRATQRCIANDFDLPRAGPDETEDYLRQCAFEQQVLSQLAKCCA